MSSLSFPLNRQQMKLAHYSATRLHALCRTNYTVRRNASLFIRPTKLIKDGKSRRLIRRMLAVPARCAWKGIRSYSNNGEAHTMNELNRRERLEKSVWTKIAELDQEKVELVKEREHKEKGSQPIDRNPKKTKLLLITGSLGLAALLIYVDSFFWDEVDFSKPFNTPPRFSDFELEKREQLSPTSMLITTLPILNRVGRALDLKDIDYYTEQWDFGTWSVEIKQPQLQISRDYTPLPPDVDSPGKLRFLIRKEKGGEMSNYLWGLKERDKLELRGPKLGFELKKGITDVVFLAGGTGIAPALQVAYTLLEKRKYDMNQPLPRIRILWANRRREELQSPDQITAHHQLGSDENDTGIPTTSKTSQKTPTPIVKILTDLQQKHPGCLEITYLVDEEGSMINQKLISSAMKRDEETIERGTEESMSSKLLFVSGPEGFINHFAGPKKWQGGGEQQGGVGGILGNMGINGWKVWKL